MTRGGRQRFFRAFALASTKPRKNAKARRKKSTKSGSAERERKSANSRFPPKVENRFQSPKPLGSGGKQGS